MDEVPIKRSVMVENKKFTHDMFVREGFTHLRPLTASFERRYHPELAKQILRVLGVPKDGAVVLKLCNRSRGAGVCVVTAHELDGVLTQLLVPPDGDKLTEWLEERMPKALTYTFESQFEETCLHWWSNECPVFVVEECCHSLPVPMEPGGSERFDGTLRVAFALYRQAKTHKWEGMRSIRPFEIDWLGGYWKLPRIPNMEDSKGGSLEELHDRIVSSFNSMEKRTAEVDEAHLHEVYNALSPVLPRIFQTGSLGVQQIQDTYTKDTLFCAFALSRTASQMRTREMPKARSVYELARIMVPLPAGEAIPEDLPQRSVLSYMDRNAGVCLAMQGDWASASLEFKAALRALPTNATAHYQLGCYYQEQGLLKEAATSLLRSIALDPDFKLSYIVLGTVHLLQEKFEEAVGASRACLRRHPDAPVAQFNLGQAGFQLLRLGRVPTGELQELRREAAGALAVAKQRESRQWAEADEEMLQHLTSPSMPPGLQGPAPHAWKCYGWRP